MQSPAGLSLGIPAVAEVDFSQFGAVSTEALNERQRRHGACHDHRQPQCAAVTQFDQADITEFEAFRVAQNRPQRRKVSLSLLPLCWCAGACGARLSALCRFADSQ